MLAVLPDEGWNIVVPSGNIAANIEDIYKIVGSGETGFLNLILVVT